METTSQPKLYEGRMPTQYAKMSKSAGNGVSPEDVIFGVCRLDDNYAFCDTDDFWVPISNVRRKSWESRMRMKISDRMPVFLWPKAAIASWWIQDKRDGSGEIAAMQIRSVYLGDGDDELVVHEEAFER